MKICAIGDIHGRSDWKSVISMVNQYDLIVFVGDYFDPYENITGDNILQNILDIIEFKKTHNNKVVLLYGNHDNIYMHGYDKCPCSRFNRVMSLKYREVLEINKDIFTPFFKIKNYLFTHAGMTKQWLSKFNKYYNIEPEHSINIDVLNGAYWKSTTNPLFDVSYIRGGGEMYGGPFWADKMEWETESLIPNIHQIIGHTQVDEFQTVLDTDQNASVTFIDILGNKNRNCDFFELTI